MCKGSGVGVWLGIQDGKEARMAGAEGLRRWV